jgi:murein DD-endopeptidase MepM/ murein hydrolase activator NlpD
MVQALPTGTPTTLPKRHLVPTPRQQISGTSNNVVNATAAPTPLPSAAVQIEQNRVAPDAQPNDTPGEVFQAPTAQPVKKTKVPLAKTATLPKPAAPPIPAAHSSHPPAAQNTNAASASKTCAIPNFAWPTRGPLSQGYGPHHLGIDIAEPLGTPIYAAEYGIVSFSGWDEKGFGNRIVIRHCGGWMTSYSHLRFFEVVVGQSVRRGQLIGYSGTTGHSTGPHLDFRIAKNGVWLNPGWYLQ